MTGIRPAQTLILWTLQELAAENDGVAEISIRELARRCFVTFRTVFSVVKELEERGFIAVERRTGQWQEPETNRYRVLEAATERLKEER